MDYHGITANKGGIGNIYYVCLSTSTIPYAHLCDYHQQTYLDGSTAVQTSIAAALTATVTERNDYVLVMTDGSDYDEGQTTTIDKTGVHLIAPGGIGAPVGCLRAVTIDPNTSAHAITVSGRGVEVGGFYIRGYEEKYCITITGGMGHYIHNNDCQIASTETSGTAACGIYITDQTGQGSKIANNYIWANGTGATCIGGIIGSGVGAEGCTRGAIIGNYILTGHGMTMTNGIYFSGILGCIADNYLMELPTTGQGAGVFGCAIRSAIGMPVINNRIMMADPSNALIGGGATPYINNICSLNGGTICQ